MGGVTASTLLVFLFPGLALRLMGQRDRDPAPARLLAQHWGLCVAMLGGVLIYAAYDGTWREHIALGALVGKAAIVALILWHWKQPFARRLLPILVFDGLCVGVLGLWLLGVA